MTKDREQRMQEARKLWNQGKSASEISVILHVRYNTAVEYVRDMPDWDERKKKSKKKEIYSLILQGKSTSEIAKITGNSTTTINRCKRELREKSGEMQEEEQCTNVPLGFKWKWPLTVNLIRRSPMDVPAHSREEELEYLNNS